MDNTHVLVPIEDIENGGFEDIIGTYKKIKLPYSQTKIIAAQSDYIKNLEEALEWYANSDNYLSDSVCDRELATAYENKKIELKARQALQSKK